MRRLSTREKEFGRVRVTIRRYGRAAKKKARKTYEKYIESWLGGNENGMRGKSSISKHIRRWLFLKYDGQCAKCGWHEVNLTTGLTPLSVEHIDGNFRNNRPENLTLLCPNCHSLTSTYKSLNKGNGRPRQKEVLT